MTAARPLSLLVAAAGTGGHVFPGIALARTALEYDPAATIRFAGTTRGIETRVVPEAGFELDLLPVQPLSRRLARETLLAPFAAVAGVAAAQAAWTSASSRRPQACRTCTRSGCGQWPVAATRAWLILRAPWLPPNTNRVRRSGSRPNAASPSACRPWRSSRVSSGRTGLPTTTVRPGGKPAAASLTPRAIRLATLAASRLAIPGTAFCSWSTTGTRSSLAATATGRVT